MTHFIKTLDKSHSGFVEIVEPKNRLELSNVFKKNNKIITIGSGLSFVPNFFLRGGKSISLKKFNNIITINKSKLLAKVEAGITVDTLLKTLLRKNLTLKIIPGWPSVSIGSCVANNVHGKNPYKDGIFQDIVQEIEIITPNENKILIANRKKNSNLFYNTCGGYGLTGTIISVTLKINKIFNKSLLQEKYFVKSISEAVKILKENKNYTNIYSWHNYSLLTKKNWGKGIVFVHKDTKKNISKNDKSTHKLIPKVNLTKINQPINFYNSFTIKILNIIFYYINYLFNSKSIKIYKSYFPMNTFPIYLWYFFGGKKGFVEYQVIIPYRNFEQFLHKLKKILFNNKITVYGNLIKLFNGQSNGLSFNGRGVCMNLEILNSKENIFIFKILDKLIIKYGGISALYKDSRISIKTIKKKYGKKYLNFINFIKKNDKKNKIKSEFSRKLNK